MREPVTAGAVTACTHSGYADGETVANFRDRVRAWLERTTEIDRQRGCDILLATDEALANCVDHAYRDSPTGGTMTLHLAHNPDQATIKICVTDTGRWCEPDAAADARRGRGLLLMHGLADACIIDGGTTGTTVCLHFDDCPPRAHSAMARAG